MKNKHLLSFYGLSLLVVFFVLVGGIEPALAGARFGTGCQKEYQNGWRPTLNYAWDRCGWFNDELDDTDTKIFYYNLHGAKWWWEEGGDSGTLDNVNLFFANTHGGGWTDRSVWSMWDSFTRAESTRMRLGDDSYGLSILATYSCETLKFDDGMMWTRMGPIFMGGLRIAVGSHDKLFDSYTTDECGEDFADNLQKSNSIRWSWKDAVSDWYVDNDATVMAVGRDLADCENRRDTMKWQNYLSYPRLRDSQIGIICAVYWHNL